jgi:SPP1 family predicted phage head-tail adaptor
MTTTGQLRESATLSQFVELDDGHGNVFQDWEEVATVPARIRALVGSEEVLAGRLTGVQPYVISIRYAGPAAAVTTDWKVTNARTGVEFNIRSIVVDERGAFADLLCEAGVAV